MSACLSLYFSTTRSSAVAHPSEEAKTSFNHYHQYHHRQTSSHYYSPKIMENYAYPLSLEPAETAQTTTDYSQSCHQASMETAASHHQHQIISSCSTFSAPVSHSSIQLQGAMNSQLDCVSSKTWSPASTFSCRSSSGSLPDRSSCS